MFAQRYPATASGGEHALVLAALRRHGIVPTEPGWSVELVLGGLNSRVFAVRAPDGRPVYTVRQARSALPRLIELEEQALRDVGAECATCVPALVARVPGAGGPDDALLVHRYAPGAPAALGEVSSAVRAALGACLACIHAHPRAGYTIWPASQLQLGTRRDLFLARLATLDRYTSTSGDLARRVGPLLADLRATRFDPADDWNLTTFALLHGDLSAGNLLWDDERVTLIDWEYARAGDPAEDLAYLSGEQPLPAEQCAEISEAYVAAGGEQAAIARARRYLPLVILDAALWWADYRLAQGADPTKDSDVLARLGRVGL